MKQTRAGMISLTQGAKSALVSILAALGLAGPALGQAPFPSRPITIVVPYAPGGGDILAREFIKPLSERFGQAVVVEARGGGGGLVGTQFVMNSEPDGHRILFHSSAATINQTMQKSPIVDIRTALAPVTRALDGVFAFYVVTSLPINSFREFIDYAKANPGKLNFGTSGIGASMHMITELVKSASGIDIVHVPYQGGTPALAAAVVNEVQSVVYDASLAAGQVQAGKIRMLAVASATRSPLYPSVPTISESLPGVSAGYWWGFLAPKATPRAILDRLNRDIVAALKQPDLEAVFTKRGYTVAASTPEDFARTLAAEVDQWSQVVRKTGIPLQ